MQINLHDALLHSVTVNSDNGAFVLIRISHYESNESRSRKMAEVRISNVTSMSSVVDYVELAGNAFAGNISDWSPAKRRGFTFFHLVGGAISIFGDPPVVEYIP